MFRNVQTDLVPAVREMISESLTGWADSLMVEVQHVDPTYRGASVGIDKRSKKQNTITLRQLDREVKKVDERIAKYNATVAVENEQARRAKLYLKQTDDGKEISYEPDIDQLFMNQLKFVAMLVQECGFDPEYFTEDE